MESSRKRLNLVKYVSYRVQHPRQHPFILGSGRKNPGPGYILAMLDHLWESYFNKWIEVYPTSSTSATASIEKLRQAFANHGLPEMVHCSCMVK